MKKFLFGLAILVCTASLFACSGKYVILIDGNSQKCFDNCGDAKSYAAHLLQTGKAKSVRIDTRAGKIISQNACSGVTYTSAEDIH